jgi:hypothetical protein
MCQYIFKFSVSCMLSDKKSSFRWRLVVVYSSPYDEGKPEFIDDLYMVLSMWQGPTVIGGGGFNLCRFSSDKSNDRINKKMADCFNDWVNMWGLVEINPGNRKFTWANNQRGFQLVLRLEMMSLYFTVASVNWKRRVMNVALIAL